MEDWSKSKFKELLPLATKDLHFFSDIIISKQIDGLAIGLPLGPTLVNAIYIYPRSSRK